MSNLIKTFNGENKKTPIWLMRQAGRYMPEYMLIRSNINSFLDLCYDSKNATKVTMQPVGRFDLDAAILFSDILVLPHALNWDVTFSKGEGPLLRKFENDEDLNLISDEFSSKINYVYETVSNVKALLPKHVSLIGFAGSPWTVMSYMLEGKGKQDFSVSKNFLYTKEKTAIKLVEIITNKTIEYLSGQIQAGVEIIQLFDSWSGVLNGDLYEKFVIEPTKKIILSLKKKFPDVPIIGFPRGSGFNYDNYIDNTDIDGLGVDQFTPIAKMKIWQKKLVVQGNLDPVILLGSKENIKKNIDNIMLSMDHKNFIFNLGHGILPTTPVENVEYLVNYVKNFK
ncbi:MAG: uroporphyrinogen decarboxylase [Rickettsiales bacterium]|nr:MAG: uroporphyrinogen decarboxylase [Rickettsiales bacterium]